MDGRMPGPANDTGTVEYAGTDLEAMAQAVNYHRWILDSINPFLGHTVAEVGAGCGNLSLQLAARAKRVLAFEPSPGMAARLSDRVRDVAAITPINAAFSVRAASLAATFDSIVYINVLEHIEDDLAEIALARGALKPGGHLCLFVPALGWLYSEFDRSIGHYRRYTLPVLRQAVVNQGFHIVKSTYIDMFGILPWWIMMVKMRSGLNPASTAYYDRWCIPLIRFIEGRIRVPVGKNILLVAKRPAD